MDYYDEFITGQSDFIERLECHSAIELLSAYVYAKTGQIDLENVYPEVLEAMELLDMNIIEIKGNHASDN